MHIIKVYKLFIFCLVIALTGCASNSVDMSKGAYKVGKPYVVNGKRYVPEVDYSYSETGIASWYGPGFDGKRTANGERFNSSELTAAHRTLPMPSIVRVTNLENGKSIMVRVNDRGPFSRSRIIDVSKRAAELLGFKTKGTAKVRVTILENESKRIADAAMNGQDTKNMNFLSEQPAKYQNAVLENSETKQPQTTLQTKSKYIVSGNLTDNRFYPNPVVSQNAVKPTHIYVQAGAFSTRENAEKLAAQLEEFGDTQIIPVSVQEKMYYRVRMPVKNDTVNSADILLNQVIRAGNKNAIIIVD